ncbi:MAG: DUF6788 family protein, partial [Trebonia sp.]
DPMTTPPPPPQQRAKQLLDELSGLGFCLPGSLSTRQMRCGNPRCRCHADPPKLHGPYTYWTRKVKGRSVAQLLTTEQLERYQPWVDNDRRLRQLVGELEALAVQAAQHTEGWEPKPRSPRRRAS